MKTPTFIGILLTLSMLLIVAVATFIFLFPRQQKLVEQTNELTAVSDQLRQEQAQTSLELAASEATREATAATLATAEANGVILAGELVESDQQTAELLVEQDNLTAQLAEAGAAMAELRIAYQRMKSQFPFAIIITPEEGTMVSPGESVDVWVAAYDPAGLTAVNLTLDDETHSFDPKDEPFFAHRQSWQLAQGEHTVSLMVVNSGGEAGAPVSVAVQAVDFDLLNAEIRSEVEANVVELTGLSPLEPIEPTLLTRDELGARLEADLAEETTLEDARRDTLVLSAFDFVEPDYDLYQALLDLLSDGVLGFYDPETAEFVVISDDSVLDAEEQLTHAHEFVHALQDQYYALDALEDDNLDSEAAAALRALAEGHATLVQSLYLTSGYFSPEEIDEIFAGFDEEGASFLDDAPSILRADLEFPYTAGLEFALTLYRQGGFAAIGDAWSNLPQSTEHILHPERYLAGDAPQIVTLPALTDTLGAGWRLLDEDTLGEFYLRQYLGQQLDADSAVAAAEGWGGDR
ncbi:MAG: hypothetical protein GY803_30555, partial [Chloroflexi bacterium]|nr:hypothetical protein [Chloroflexota bacterium]